MSTLLDRAAAATPPIPAPRPSWPARFASALGSTRTGVALLLTAAALTFLGTAIGQAPDSVRGDQVAYAGWLAEASGTWGPATALMNRLGLFTVFSTPYFAATMGLLAVSIVVSTVRRLPALWRQATRTPTGSPAALGDPARCLTATVPLGVGEATARVQAVMSRHRLRVVRVSPDLVYGDRFRFCPLATVVSHGAFVVIIVGVLISSFGGFTDPMVPAVTGEPTPLGHGTGLTVTARSVTETYDARGRPTDLVSDLALATSTGQVARRAVRVNDPLRWGDLTIHQAVTGVAADLAITDHGRPVFRGGVPLQYEFADGSLAVGVVHLESRGQVLQVVAPAGGRQLPGIASGEVILELYDDGAGEPITRRVLGAGGRVHLAGLVVDFRRERPFAGLLVTSDPGARWVWTGSALLLIGLVLTLGVRPRRMWARIEASDTDASRVLLHLPSSRRAATWSGRLIADLDPTCSLADSHSGSDR